MLNLEKMVMRFKKEELVDILGTEVNSSDTKAILCNSIITRVEAMCTVSGLFHSVIDEPSDDNKGKVVFNSVRNNTLIPTGGIVAYPYNGYRDSLVNFYRDIIINGELEEILVTKVNPGSRVICVPSLSEYMFLIRLFGKYVINENMPSVGGCATICSIDYQKLSKYFDGIQFTSNLIRESISNDCEFSLYGLRGNTTIFFNANISLLNIINIDSLASFIDYYIPKADKKKRQFETKIVNISNLVYDGTRFVLRNTPENACVYTGISESRVARLFGKEDSRIVKKIDDVGNEVEVSETFYNLYNFSTFKGIVTKSMIMAELDKDCPNYRQLTDERCKFLYESTKEKLESRVKAVLIYGYFDDELGKTFIPCAKSFSQSRTGGCTFSCENWDVVSFKLLCGDPNSILDKDGKCNYSKYDGRKALSFTNSIATHVKPIIKVIPDKTEIALINAVTPKQIIDFYGDIILEKSDFPFDKISKQMNRFMGPDGYLCEAYIPSNLKKLGVCYMPADGQSSGTVEFFTELSWSYNKITAYERDYFLKAYKNLDLSTLRTYGNKKVLRIFDKILTKVQFRHALDKGMVIMDDFNKRIPEYSHLDILMTESVRKVDSSKFRDEDGRSKLEFAIVSTSKKQTGKAFLNYQNICASNISSEDLIGLANSEYKKIESAILTDSVLARNFLGLVHNINDEECDYQKNKIVSLLSEALEVAPICIKDEYINKKLRLLLGKYLWEIGFGRIPVDGGYFYLATDPLYLTDRKNCLQSGEFYLNNMECDVVLTRNPLIHRSEAIKITTTSNDRLWYLKDCMVLNPFDGILPALGGADCDGDKALCVWDDRITKFYTTLPYIIMDNKKFKAPTHDITEENLRLHYASSIRVSKIGIITNYATYFRDLELSGFKTFIDKTGRVHLIDNLMTKFRFIQGWEIDSEKSGVEITIPEYMKVDKKPAWLLYRKEFYSDSETFIRKKGKVSIDESKVETLSCSPMTNLFNYASLRVPEILGTEQGVDLSLSYALLKNCDKALYEKLRPRLVELEFNCRRDISILSQTAYYGLDKALLSADEKEAIEYTLWEKINLVYNDYRYNLLSFAKGNKSVIDTLVATAYDVCYNRRVYDNSKSRSFVWHVFRNELLDLFMRNTKGDSILRVPVKDVPVNDVVINNIGAMLVNNKYITMTNVIPGSYKPLKIDDKYVIVVPRLYNPEYLINTAPLDPKYTDSCCISVSACNSHSIKMAYDTIVSSNNTFSVQEYDSLLWIVANETPLMQVTSFGLDDLSSCKDKIFTLLNPQFDSYIYRPSKYEVSKNDSICWVDDEKVYAYRQDISFMVKPIGTISEGDLLESNKFACLNTKISILDDDIDYSDIEAYESSSACDFDLDGNDTFILENLDITIENDSEYICDNYEDDDLDNIASDVAVLDDSFDFDLEDDFDSNF